MARIMQEFAQAFFFNLTNCITLKGGIERGNVFKLMIDFLTNRKLYRLSIFMVKHRRKTGLRQPKFKH